MDRAVDSEISSVSTGGNGSPGTINTILSCGELPGDLNGDGSINIVDIVIMVGIILGEDYTDCQESASDINNDGLVNVVDVIQMVNIILEDD